MQAKIALTAMILSLLLVPMAAATPRAVVSLDGAWRMVKVESLDVPPPTDGWVEFEVPGTLRGHDYERAWFRRAFEVPADWAGRRVVVRFGGVKYASRVMVNGDRVGECFNGYDAFEVDATAAIRPGETNELSVGVHDWTGVFDEGERIDVRAATNRSELRALPRDRVLAPIGGYVDLYGIWDSVELEAMPAAHLDDLSFRPSIRGNRAEIDVAVVNDSTDALAADVQARVYAYDGSPRESSGVWAVTGEPVGVASVPVGTVAAGMNSRVTLTLSEPQVDLWWPHDPKLYILEVRLNDGADVLRERVGFRELWCEGGDFVFNGRRVHLLASSWWPPSTPPRRDEVEARLRGIKAMNAFCFRTHTQPWHRLWYEVADELGVMMIPEAAIWNDDSVYRLGDAVFWSNYADHVRAMVRHLRNHASVVMWSLENEFQGGLAKDGSPAEDALAQLGRLVKEFDPTRPITFESDGDPGGVADVIGLHYPNEYPERRCWPNDAYWMDEPSTTWRGNMFWHDDTFFWNREKPLYIGEFLWAPACDPAPDTIFFGDQAYADFRAYHDRAKAESWRMQILAYRHYGVSGISPWTVREHGDLDETNPCWRAQRDLYRPVAAFLRESDARFLSEERLARTLWVFNDSLRDWPETQLSWSLESERGTLSRDRQTLDLASGAQREIPLTIPLPSVDVRTTLRIEIGLAAGEEALFSETWPIEVFPRRVGWTLPGVTLYVHDPRRALEEAWRKAGVAFVRIDALDAWPGDGVLILGPGALETPAAAGDVPVIGAVNAAGAALYERVGAGGRVLAIGQAPAAGAWLPARATPQQSTMAFVQEPGHPVLEGLSDADLRWWRGDNMVTVHEYQRPVGGPGHALVVTGSAQGIAHAPLVEVPHGDGVWMLCQFQVVEKLGFEPLAQILLERMIQYLADYAPPAGRTRCIGAPPLADRLQSLHVDAAALDNWTELRYPETGLLILDENCGGSLDTDRLRTFVDAGGAVLWNRPRPEVFATVRDALNWRLSMTRYRGAVTREEGTSALVNAIAREDLYWLGEHSGWHWSPTPRALNMARYVFAPSIEPSPEAWREAENDVTLEGTHVRRDEDQVVLATVGTATWNVSLPRTGRYILSVRASGTPFDDVYPVVEARLDRRPLGTIYVDGRITGVFSVAFEAEKGPHALGLAFANDANSETQDRNLEIDGFAITPWPDGLAFEPVTSPPAVLELPMGAGRVVLNGLITDNVGRNITRADRFYSALLHGLGARFSARRPADVVEAETLEPQPNLNNCRRDADHIYLGSTGVIEGPVVCATAGRYRVTIRTKGTEAGGEWPRVVVALGEQPLGQVECVSEQWHVQTFVTLLPEGEHVLRVAFMNDLYAPPEDRNVWIDRIEFELLDEQP